jgi:hypothetical protein
MNYSNGTLHVIGSAEAVDKHQGIIIERSLRELYKTDRYLGRCADDFTAVRVTPEYLAIHFRTREGWVPLDITHTNAVLIDDDQIPTGRKPNINEELALRLGIPRLHATPNRRVRFAVLPNAQVAYIKDPGFRVIVPVVEYLNADPRTADYEEGAAPQVRLSYLIATVNQFWQLLAPGPAPEESQYIMDFALVADNCDDEDSWVGAIDGFCESGSARWTTSPDAVTTVASMGPEHIRALALIPGLTVVTGLEELSNIAPPRRTAVLLQETPAEDRLVTVLTWAHESSRYNSEYMFFAVRTGSDYGVYHPPVMQQEFLRAVTTINNYMAAQQVTDKVEGFPRDIATTQIDAEIRALWLAEAESEPQSASRSSDSFDMSDIGDL